MMRKNKILSIFVLIASFFVTTGCNDYLDVDPDERLEVNSLDKVEATIVGAYQNDRSYRFTDFCTDNTTITENVNDNEPIIEDLYSWSRDFRNQTHQDSPSSYWQASYGSIANINLALESLEQLNITSEMSAKADALRGEALVMRSYCHFMLVNLFAKHYDITTAKSDVGIPYVTLVEKELRTNYQRGTVEDAYNKAEKDLLDGIALLEKNTKEVNKNKYRFTFPSVYLYASRFYNFRNRDGEDLDKTLLYANKAIESFGGIEAMRPWADYQTDDNGTIDIEQQEIGMVQSSATWTTYEWTNQMTSEIRDEELARNPFKKSDDRLAISYKRSGNVFTPAFYFVYVPGKNGYSATDIFPLAEAVLNVAEASIRKNDFDKAKEMLTVIGENVYDSYNPADLTSENLKAFYKLDDEKAAWTNYLLFERRNMFLMKGFRWFDIKRYDLDVEHKLEDGTTIKLSIVAPNKDFQIPNYAISAGMEANK